MTEMDGEKLRIYFDTKVRPTKDVVVKIASPTLNGLDASGASHSTLKGVRSDHFSLALSGTAQCAISGWAKTLAVKSSGAATLDGQNLDAGAATVVSSGTSTIKIRAEELRSVDGYGASGVTVDRVITNNLKIQLRGTSRCTVSGEASDLTVESGGASRLDAVNLKATSVRIDASGTSRVEVQPVRSLSGSASGAATVRYTNDPAKQTVVVSGTATVRRK
jgi:hypothetical protein